LSNSLRVHQPGGAAIIHFVPEGDPRLLPRYSTSEAARYLWVNPATLAAWSRGRLYEARHERRLALPVFQASGAKGLSFINLVEAHVLAALRQKHRLPMGKIRAAIRWLRKQYDTEHPLLHPDLATDGLNLFVDELNRIISASEGGQTVMPEMIAKFLKRIHRDKLGLPVRFYPFTRDPVSADSPEFIVMDPRVADGRPVIQGTRVSPSMLLARFESGDEPEQLAADYDLDMKVVHEALRSRFERKAA
jgi:uncharacterized protein (DUF433 family)